MNRSLAIVRPSLACLAAASSLFASAAQAQAVMEPGAWETRTKITGLDLESGQTKTFADATTKVCYTLEFLAKEIHLTPGVDQRKAEAKGAKCGISDARREGNTASWKMDCTLADGTRTEAVVRNVAAKRTFSSEVSQTVYKQGHEVPMKISAQSRHVGACTADMPSM